MKASSSSTTTPHGANAATLICRQESRAQGCAIRVWVGRGWRILGHLRRHSQQQALPCAASKPDCLTRLDNCQNPGSMVTVTNAWKLLPSCSEQRTCTQLSFCICAALSHFTWRERVTQAWPSPLLTGRVTQTRHSITTRSHPAWPSVHG